MKLMQHQRCSFERSNCEKPYFHKEHKVMSFDRFHSPYSPSNRGYHSHYPSGRNFPTYPSNPTPWACDYCNLATFRTYEEAYNHEKVCHMNPRSQAGAERNQLPQRQSQVSPAINGPEPSRKRHNDPNSPFVEKDSLLLAMPKDHESLSNRQCYVRSQFVELFTATEADVASRHSKGAQKLHVGQQGLRCRFCKNLPIGERIERSVCYPSSISRIYQTVADMQRFHFERCSEIPLSMKKTYKSLKTTRPRGVGSPQQYWISSAQELGLVDSAQGIRFSTELDDNRHSPTNSVPSMHSTSHYSPDSPNSCSRDPSPSSPRLITCQTKNNIAKVNSLLVPLSPESHAGESHASTVESQDPVVTNTTMTQPKDYSEAPVASTVSFQEEKQVDDFDAKRSDASILLALRNTRVQTSSPS